MDHNFPEALDAVLVDNALVRRACNAKLKDKYIGRKGGCLLFIDGTAYTPSNEDIFAEDWQIFGKGVLGTGHVNKEKK